MSRKNNKPFWGMQIYNELIQPLSKRTKRYKELMHALTVAVKYNIPFTAGDFCTILPRDYFGGKQ